MNIELLPAYNRKEELLPLYEEYAAYLVQKDPVFTKSLEQQNYDEELSHLEGKYGMPEGRIYVLHVDGKTAGCVGLRKSDETHGELKRLYLRKEFRGNKLGRFMTEQIIEDAKEAGYSYLRLDTLPPLETAIALYREMGFYETESYYDCLVPATIFMELKL